MPDTPAQQTPPPPSELPLIALLPPLLDLAAGLYRTVLDEQSAAAQDGKNPKLVIAVRTSIASYDAALRMLAQVMIAYSAPRTFTHEHDRQGYVRSVEARVQRFVEDFAESGMTSAEWVAMNQAKADARRAAEVKS